MGNHVSDSSTIQQKRLLKKKQKTIAAITFAYITKKYPILMDTLHQISHILIANISDKKIHIDSLTKY